MFRDFFPCFWAWVFGRVYSVYLGFFPKKAPTIDPSLRYSGSDKGAVKEYHKNIDGGRNYSEVIPVKMVMCMNGNEYFF